MLRHDVSDTKYFSVASIVLDRLTVLPVHVVRQKRASQQGSRRHGHETAGLTDARKHSPLHLAARTRAGVLLSI